MKIIASLTDSAVMERIINHLKLTFVAERPPPPHMVCRELLMAAETSAECFFMTCPLSERRGLSDFLRF